MIYQPSPAFTLARSLLGMPCTENDIPSLSPKRCFAQQEEDQPSKFGPKRRHLQQDPRRAPLDPLSASDLENRRMRRSQSVDSLSHLALVAPSALPNLRVLPSSSGLLRMQLSSTSDGPVYSWPPLIPAAGSGGSSHDSSAFVGLQAPQDRLLHPSRAGFFSGPDSPQTFSVQTERESEDVLRPVRLRTFSPPSVHMLSEELGRQSGGSAEVAYEPVDPVDLLLYPTPPGLTPPSELRRGSSDPVLQGSVSLSLAHGSQPLKASEPTKVVLPIGAERCQVASKSATEARPALVSHSPLHASPRLQAKWKNGDMRPTIGHPAMSKEDLERLLRHAVWNRHAPRILSPLNPLRTATPAFNLTADPAYILRLPSRLNTPSPRYSQCPPRRARTLCDSYQSFDLNTTCVHCQECKRDSICKRLLALRYHQHQSYHVQRSRVQPAFSCRGTNLSIMDDDRIMLANRIREVYTYDLDEEEKSLWEEVAAVTGASPVPFPRVGAPCAAAVHRRAVDDGCDDAPLDGCLEIGDDGMRADESATLREVSIY